MLYYPALLNHHPTSTSTADYFSSYYRERGDRFHTMMMYIKYLKADTVEKYFSHLLDDEAEAQQVSQPDIPWCQPVWKIAIVNNLYAHTSST